MSDLGDRFHIPSASDVYEAVPGQDPGVKYRIATAAYRRHLFMIAIANKGIPEEAEEAIEQRLAQLIDLRNSEYFSRGKSLPIGLPHLSLVDLVDIIPEKLRHTIPRVA